MIAKIGNCYFKLLYIPIFFKSFKSVISNSLFLDYHALYEKYPLQDKYPQKE